MYADGVSEDVGALIDAVDAERLAIAKACGLDMVPIYEFLIEAYPPFDGATVTNSYEWFHSRMRSEAGEIHLEAVPGPTSFNVRLLEEDIPYGMVPLEGLGAVLSVPTPTVTMFIDEACELLGADFRESGRSAEKMQTEISASLANLGVEV